LQKKTRSSEELRANEVTVRIEIRHQDRRKAHAEHATVESRERTFIKTKGKSFQKKKPTEKKTGSHQVRIRKTGV